MAFHLNFSPTKNKEKYSFDLNISPSDDHASQIGIEDFGDDSEPIHTNDSTNIEDGGSIPIRVVSSSEGTLLIDLNLSPVEESDAHLLELNLNQLYEESEDPFVGDSGIYKSQSLHFLYYYF